jgi:uncharacterized protein YegL
MAPSDEFELPPESPFMDLSLVENPEQRCPVVLLIDTSYSMSGEKMRCVNEGVQQLIDELNQDSLAAKRVELCIVGFGPVNEHCGFTTVNQLDFSPCVASGTTPMGEAINFAIRKLEERKESYKQVGVNYYRPWIFLLTDGGPTDSWKEAASNIQSGEKAGKFTFFSVGVEGANMSVLGQLSVQRPPAKLQGYSFKEMFSWLSKSLSSISHSQSGEQVQMPSADSWATIEV